MKKISLHAQSKEIDEQTYQFAVLELTYQCLFADEAFRNISKKGEGEKIMTFSSIHSFLTHCANISKILWSSKPNPKYPNTTLKEVIGENVADRLRIGGSSPIKDMWYRNGLDHYDERIVKWVKDFYPQEGKPQASMFDLTMSKKHSPHAVYLRHYDPDTGIFTLMDKELNLKILYNEVVKIQKLVGGPSNLKKYE